MPVAAKRPAAILKKVGLIVKAAGSAALRGPSLILQVFDALVTSSPNRLLTRIVKDPKTQGVGEIGKSQFRRGVSHSKRSTNAGASKRRGIGAERKALTWA
jgi:hypothetical protein